MLLKRRPRKLATKRPLPKKRALRTEQSVRNSFCKGPGASSGPLSLKQVKTGTISLATTPQDVARCHAVMRELRPHYDDEARFVADVMEQRETGFQLAFIEWENVVRSVAGFRVTRNLSWGRHLFVDDLVTREQDHGTGFGSQLFEWLIAEARRQGCESVQLDSGVKRYGAHRFYHVRGMSIIAHHFSLGLD